MDMKVGKGEPVEKHVMSDVVGIAEEVVQAFEAFIEEVREQEGKKTSKVQHSFPKILKVFMAEAKTEGDLDQMIAYVSDPSSKIEKMKDLQETYHGCKYGVSKVITLPLIASTLLVGPSNSIIL